MFSLTLWCMCTYNTMYKVVFENSEERGRWPPGLPPMYQPLLCLKSIIYHIREATTAWVEGENSLSAMETDGTTCVDGVY